MAKLYRESINQLRAVDRNLLLPKTLAEKTSGYPNGSGWSYTTLEVVTVDLHYCMKNHRFTRGIPSTQMIRVLLLLWHNHTGMSGAKVMDSPWLPPRSRAFASLPTR
jgi:hypothetical protein